MQYKCFYFNELRACTYVVWDETRECVIIDAGCQSESEQQRLVKFMEQNQLKPQKLVCTHAHFDHILGYDFACKTFKIAGWLHRADLPMFEHAVQYAKIFGQQMQQPELPSHFLQEGDAVRFGDSHLQVLYTPGHSKGCVCLYAKADKLLFSGDTLFDKSVGRSDLPGGSYEELMNSIITKLLTLPDDVVVLPGHGPATTIGSERRDNPFIKDATKKYPSDK